LKKILIVTKHFKYEKIGGGAQKSIEYLVENLKETSYIEYMDYPHWSTLKDKIILI